MTEGRESFKFAIDVTLTEAEINDRLERNAEIDRKILDIQAQKAMANQGFNGDLKLLRKEQVTLLESAKAGKAKLEVDCYQECDDRRGMMITRRNDNGDIVDERALTAEERGETPDDRQGKLFDDPSAAAPTPDAIGDDSEEFGGDEDAERALDEYVAANASEGDDEEAAAPPVDEEIEHPTVN